ncbi:hypothetical protein C8A00DRAFT_28769 [Chaetomidium leptoderma]|uniref:chitin synthase n=1 Tax=Chaetomidium leptoderma TaxID=669021 RepID=A0AAN6VV66_9PEZI|nr:hypothetical protein C8A00DRAFT_28769 [Chaetomidium leptoderma]
MSVLHAKPNGIAEIAKRQIRSPNTFHQLKQLPSLDHVLEHPRPIIAVPPVLPADPLPSNHPSTEDPAFTSIDPPNPARRLTVLSVSIQRAIFISLVVSFNAGLALATIMGKSHDIRRAFVLLFKVKDYACVFICVLGLLGSAVHKMLFGPPSEVPRQWILSLIPTYNESEEQILKCISSLRDNDLGVHRQIMVVMMDGKPKDLLRDGMSRVVFEEKRPYHSLKYTSIQLHITAGWLHQTAAILIEKGRNCGKKDSLVLCHDLFNYPRDNMPQYSRDLRDEMWTDVLPALIEQEDWHEFRGFDGVFCTDADSKLSRGCVRLLMEALARNDKAIAAAGSVFVELEPGFEWSFWNLHQQFQYTFGQFVRRRAEGYMGKVTCLPGCVTMIAVRKEMAGAIQKYASPVTSKFVLEHQVQNLGHHLSTLFVPEAVSETVAPQSLQHYLSQRRRWGSNSYFNNYFSLGGERMSLLTRAAAASDTLRQTFVYYRVLNTVLFLQSLVAGRRHRGFDSLPVLVAGQLPLAWYAVCLLLEPELRRRAHKLVLGFFLNKLVSPFLAVRVFTLVALNLGNHAWGVSGVTATSLPSPPMLVPSKTENINEAGVLHFVLFVRACVETHRVNSIYPHSPEFVLVSNGKGDENLPQVSVVQQHGNAPVAVPLAIAGHGGTSTDVYVVTGLDGRPQLLAPVGTILVGTTTHGHQ